MITLIGLGTGNADTLSRGAEKALRELSLHQQNGTGILFLRTAIHPTVALLNEWGLAYTPLDSYYEQGSDFAAVYQAITQRVLSSVTTQTPHIGYAVPGHPLFAEEASQRILEGAKEQGITTQVITSGSFVEAVLTSIEVSLAEGCDIRDALTLREKDAIAPDGTALAGGIDVSRGLLLYQVYDKASASHAKLCLMRHYPDDWEVVVVKQAGVPHQESIKRTPLFRLDRESVDHLTSVYVPPLPPALRRHDFASLVGIMARLRAPDGCPWDREQSHQSLKRYFIEETYEVIEAIDADDPDLLCEELGDALLQSVFHAQLADEEAIFGIDDVVAQICEKLVRRHPHVFGEVDVANSEEVLKNWERIKRAEKANDDKKRRDSLLDGVPKGLPALMQAMEISKRVVKVGFEWKQFEDVLAKVEEELIELKAELNHATPNKANIASELGDLLFTMVQIARWQGVDAEEALRGMLGRFSARFRYIEKRAKEQSRLLTDMTLEEMDALWNEAKALKIG